MGYVLLNPNITKLPAIPTNPQSTAGFLPVVSLNFPH
jgi:hypothetical protein